MTIGIDEALIDRYPAQSNIVLVKALPAIDELIDLIDMPLSLATKLRINKAFDDLSSGMMKSHGIKYSNEL